MEVRIRFEPGIYGKYLIRKCVYVCAMRKQDLTGLISPSLRVGRAYRLQLIRVNYDDVI